MQSIAAIVTSSKVCIKWLTEPLSSKQVSKFATFNNTIHISSLDPEVVVSAVIDGCCVLYLMMIIYFRYGSAEVACATLLSQQLWSSWCVFSRSCLDTITYPRLQTLKLRRAKYRSTHRSTHRLINKLIQQTVETGLVTAVTATIELILFLASKHTNIHIAL